MIDVVDAYGFQYSIPESEYDHFQGLVHFMAAFADADEKEIFDSLNEEMNETFGKYKK